VADQDDVVPMLPEATLEQIFDEIKRRCPIAILSTIQADQSVTYFFTGHPCSAIGLLGLTLADMESDMRELFRPEEKEEEEEDV